MLPRSAFCADSDAAGSPSQLTVPVSASISDTEGTRVADQYEACENVGVTPSSTSPDGAGVHAPAMIDESAWVVIPLYNEGTVIGGVIRDLLQHFSHVVCVDDGSSDDSAAAARAAGALLVQHPINLGQGAALQTGFEFALGQPRCEYVVTFDADGQHRIEDALQMLEVARRDDIAIVFGSRFLDKRTNPGLIKRIVLKTAVWVTNMTTGMHLTDAHNGLRVIRRDALSQVDLKQDRMAHATEIVIALGSTGLPWREHPVELLYTDYSKGKGQSVLNSINILVDLVVR